jgi:hypothetical protein
MKLKLKPPIKKQVTPVKEEVQDIKPKYSNLKEIMDYTKPFELIYSGVENDSYYDILFDLGIRNFLMSYHYVQNKHISISKRFEDAPVRLFIDSGAHTYQNDPKYAEYDLEYWEKHLQGYLRWTEKNRQYIFAIANFDFENLVGPEVVDRWNKEYFEPFMLRTGIPVCFVWHQNSYNEWEYYCKRYPYVGFSSVNTEGESIDINEYRLKLKVAEKHDSLVHGFGMTRTGMLTELPFYTSDSTTWLVGLQYGEVNFWTGSKMSRLKKDAWKNKFIDEICSRYSVNKEALLEEDVTEIIKVNVNAFIDAEKFIQTRLKSMMYWLKVKTNKVNVDNLPDDFFPPAEWFDGDRNDYKDYAKKMNVNPEYEDVKNLLYDVTTFLNWGNSKYRKMKAWYLEDEQLPLISELHDLYINRIVPGLDDKIQDIILFFKDCVSGNNDKLLQLGTNFDRMIKERDSYVSDEEEELVDLDESEMRVKLYGILPTPEEGEDGAPEISSLDAEIFAKAEIVPVFDDKGHFVKGQQAVRKPKKVYSNKYPKFACDTCYAAAKCPEYKSGFVCAYHKTFTKFDTRNMSDIIQSMQGIVEHNMTRMQRAMLMEVLNGTVDPVVSQLMESNVKYMAMLKQMYENGSAEVLRQTRIIRTDGTQEETTQITNPRSSGILEKMFSGYNSSTSPAEEEDIIDERPKRNAHYEIDEDDM